MMHLRKIHDLSSEEFKQAWKIYEYSFPEDERRDLTEQKKLMQNRKYSFFVAEKGGEVLGILTSWNFNDFEFIEHLAISSEMRGRGYGTELLKLFLARTELSVFLEVEMPETEIAIKRIRFYERIGFRLNKYDYIQPPYGEGKKPVPMFIMSYPKLIGKDEFSDIREKLHIQVYGLSEPLLEMD
jgi:ribosomal protein S18 acetylase RimI-like enzyme